MVFKIQNITLVVSITLMMSLMSCKIRPPYLKINSPANGQVFTAPETITVSVEMSDPDLLFGQDLFVTKENATHDTVLNFRDHDNAIEGDLIRTFTSEPNTKYKIWVKATGGETSKADSVYVTAN